MSYGTRRTRGRLRGDEPLSMAGVPSIGAINAALESERIAAEFSIRALRTQLDAIERIGAEAIQLIEAAAIDPEVGRHIDLQV